MTITSKTAIAATLCTLALAAASPFVTVHAQSADDTQTQETIQMSHDSDATVVTGGSSAGATASASASASATASSSASSDGTTTTEDGTRPGCRASSSATASATADGTIDYRHDEDHQSAEGNGCKAEARSSATAETTSD